MKKIKNILFDLGGVLFPLSIQATIDAFKNAAKISASQIDNWLQDSDLCYRYETGRCSTEEFRNGFNDISTIKLDEATFNWCWNAMILSYPEHHTALLNALRSKGFGLYILSNINELHVKYVEQLAQWPQSLFVKKYYSNEIHLRKPDRECYEYIIKDSGIDPTETLYIDDRADNAAMGVSHGFQTINLPQNGDLYKELQHLTI